MRAGWALEIYGLRIAVMCRIAPCARAALDRPGEAQQVVFGITSSELVAAVSAMSSDAL